MESLWLFLPFLVPVVVANLGERHRGMPYATGDSRLGRLLDPALRYTPYALLIAINLGLLAVVGLALLNQLAKLVMPGELEPQALAANWWGVALACLLAAIVACLPLIPTVRRWLAHWLPIDTDSIVHTTALAFATYQIGFSLAQMALIGDLETLIDSDLVLTIWDVILTGVPLLVFALAGVGLWIRRGWQGTFKRLGLLRPTWRQLLAGIGVTVLLLAFDFGVNLAWEGLDPAGYDVVNRVAENLFGDLATVGGALALGLSAGISEELLFRGAVQPRLGLLLATILFTVGHLQYGLTIATLEIFIIGLVLGLIRNRTSTSLTILIHAAYNAAGVLLGMLSP
jgi:membrane protease YdiL (CAAX protease family)